MLVRVLGSAAGGGFPQWNCHCQNCRSVRAGKPGFTARTQSSIAVSADGVHWVLFNASPDLRQQIGASSRLSDLPAGRSVDSRRGSPIKAVVLTNGDVDHVAGLLTLREMQPFSIYGSQRVLSTLAGNNLFNVVSKDLVPRVEMRLDEPVALRGDGLDLGLVVEPFAVPGKVALYLEDASAGPGFGTQVGDTLALRISAPATGKSFFYIPGCAEVDAPLAARIRGAALVFFDGTLYDDEEMLRQGLMPKTGKRMGHISISGTDGTIAAFRDLGVARRVFIHINNSNPVLDDNSPERAATEAAGWEIAFDGMEIEI